MSVILSNSLTIKSSETNRVYKVVEKMIKVDDSNNGRNSSHQKAFDGDLFI